MTRKMPPKPAPHGPPGVRSVGPAWRLQRFFADLGQASSPGPPPTIPPGSPPQGKGKERGPEWGIAERRARDGVTTPAYSPQSNGLAEAFVHTFKRDYVHGAELRDAESVLAQLADWFDHYNHRAPHSAPGLRPPVEYRASLELTLPSV